MTKGNVPRYKLQFSKVTQSYVVKPIKKVPEKNYIGDIMLFIIESVKSGEQYKLPEIPQFKVSTDKPAKEEVIRFHRSRFTATPAT